MSNSFGKLMKSMFLLLLTLVIFKYALGHTYHKLTIPQDLDGEVVVKVTDADLENNYNDLFKIPLRFFPRQICLTNNNRVFSDDFEINSKEFPNVGAMKLYAKKNNEQIVQEIPVSVGSTTCRAVDPYLLEGATTTASYIQAAFIKFDANPDGSIRIIGAHTTDIGFESNIRVEVSESLLWVDLSPWGRLLLLLFSFVGISAVLLALVELLRRIRRFVLYDQFFKGF